MVAMNPDKSDMFATGRRESVDSDVLHTGLSESQSVSGSQIWSSSSRLSRRATTSTQREPQSCVSRSSAADDCATQQFLVWAAIKRNRSVKMPPSERLKCPLLLCDEQSDTHESMLRHLSSCRHLRTGEYLCWDCTKVERYNDGKCRCCTKQPSKRRKIVKLAKNFFSSIGSKSRRVEAEVNEPEETSMMPPPAYDGLLHMPEEEPLEEPAHPQIELNNTEIVGELDSGSIHQLDSINYDLQQDCQSQPIRFHTRSRSNSSSHLDDTRSRHYSNITPLRGIIERPVASCSITGSPAGSQRPSLALNTEVDQYRKVSNNNKNKNKYLTPSSSVRSQNHSHSATLGISPITPWSANSGISGTSSGSWALASSASTQMTSPTSPNSAYTTNEGLMNGWNLVQPTELICNPKDIDCSNYEKAKSKMPADNEAEALFPHLPDDIFFPSVPEKDTYSWQSSVNTEISLVNVMSFDDTPSIANDYDSYAELTPATDAGKLLIGSAWDALCQHILSSHAKIVDLVNNPLAVRFRQESPTSIATRGFETQRRLLNGTDPSDPLDYLCFVHVVYAFSLVLHEDGLAEKSVLLFRQALAYRGFLDPRWYRAYTQVVTLIWDPEIDLGHPTNQGARSSTRVRDSEVRINPAMSIETDVLAVTSQNFLDEFENLIVTGKSMQPTSITSSELWSIHMADQQVSQTFSHPFAISADFIMNTLSQSFGSHPRVAARLKEVRNRVHRQHTTTVRRLEMDLMQAGKGALSTSRFFDQYVLQCRQLCTPLYTQHSSNTRTRYHTLASSFAEQMLQTFASESAIVQHQSTNTSNLPVDIPGSLEDIFGQFSSIDSGFGVEQGIGGFLQPPNSQTTRYPDSTPLTSIPSDIMEGQLDFANLQPSDAPYPSNYSHSSVSTPGLVIGSQSPPPNVHPRKRPHSILARPQDSDAAPSTSSGGSIASTSKHLAAQSSAESPGLVGSKIEANSCCEICGYRPKGDPQWFKGSMAKHKKLQHSKEPPTIYRCPYPGCTSAYKNRQDNLRQHQIEKHHFVDEDGSQKRPQKRKRTSQ